MTRDRWLPAWALGSVALGGASLLVPLYFVATGGGVVLLGVLAGVAAIAGAPGALAIGRLADRTGARRPVVVGAFAVVAAALAVLPLTADEGPILAITGVVWLAAGGVAPVANLLVTVGHPESRWSERFAVLNVYGGWGWAGGLVVGTVWLAVAGAVTDPRTALRALSVGFAACAGIAALVAAARLPPDAVSVDAERASRLSRAARRANRVPVRSATFPIAPGRLYWLTRRTHPRELVARFSRPLSLYFLAVVVAFVGFGAFWGPLPLYLRDEGFGTSAVFALYLASSLGSALSYRHAGRLAGDGDPVRLQVGGLASRALLQPTVLAVGVVATAGVLAFALAGATFALIGIAWAAIAVAAPTVVAALAPASIRGEALGVYVAVSAVGSGAGAVLGGALAATGFGLAYAVAAGFVLAGAAGVWSVRRRDAGGTPSVESASAVDAVGGGDASGDDGDGDGDGRAAVPSPEGTATSGAAEASGPEAGGDGPGGKYGPGRDEGEDGPGRDEGEDGPGRDEGEDGEVPSTDEDA